MNEYVERLADVMASRMAMKAKHFNTPIKNVEFFGDTQSFLPGVYCVGIGDDNELYGTSVYCPGEQGEKFSKSDLEYVKRKVNSVLNGEENPKYSHYEEIPYPCVILWNK